MSPPFYQRIEPSVAASLVLKAETPPQSPLPLEAAHIRPESNDGSSSYTKGATACTTLPELLGCLALDDNWQTSKKTIRDRNAAMFMNEVMSDVHFLVGSAGLAEKPARIPAHKYVLATSSSVFFAMFYGPLAEEKDEIEIPDVEPNAFVTMLRLIA